MAKLSANDFEVVWRGGHYAVCAQPGPGNRSKLSRTIRILRKEGDRWRLCEKIVAMPGAKERMIHAAVAYVAKIDRASAS